MERLKQIPEIERMKAEGLILRAAERCGMGPEIYLRKVWYHEQAATIGEYAAMVLMLAVLEEIVARIGIAQP